MSTASMRFFFFGLSILVADFAVMGCHAMDPVESQQQVTSEDKQITTSQTPEKKRLTDETGTPYDKMSDSQIAQKKRADCRLIKETIPHNYRNK